MNVVEKLVESKKKTLRKRSLTQKIRQSTDISLICEAKKASPSEGQLAEFNVLEQAVIMQQAGACGISVLTEPTLFKGSLNDLALVRCKTNIPLLRKDFLCFEWEVAESKYAGADAILLIVSILGQQTKRYVGLAHQAGLETLVEAHNRQELRIANNSGSDLIGINNRNLKTLEVDLKVFEELAPYAEENTPLVAESGIGDRKDVLRMHKAGADAVLVGGALSKAENASEKIKKLAGK